MVFGAASRISHSDRGERLFIINFVRSLTILAVPRRLNLAHNTNRLTFEAVFRTCAGERAARNFNLIFG